MKSKNLLKLIIRNCLTKKGDIKSTDYKMLWHIIKFPKVKHYKIKINTFDYV